jgi:acyl transferase domain-containing protein
VPGEGCGVVVLKRLSDAVAQGDRIRAVIRGSAVNHDGRSSVLTAPNGPAQEAVMRAALRDGQVKPGDVGFVETHGTGTSLGDPIEVEALDAVYGGRAGAADLACVLGAVKTNFGHLEAAAGVAGLIKTVLVLERGAIPRNLNFERLNPQIRLGDGSRIELAAAEREWARGGGRTRFAGVSSFGLGGTNAHLIVEEAPTMPRMADVGVQEWCLPVSAHTAQGLETVARGYVELLRKSDVDLREIAATAARGRDHGPFRIAVSGATAAEVADRLEARLAGMDWEGLYWMAQSGSGRASWGLCFRGRDRFGLGRWALWWRVFPRRRRSLWSASGWLWRRAGFRCGLRLKMGLRMILR